MSAILPDSLREGAIVDTGPLLNVLALNFGRAHGLPFKRRQQLLSGDASFRYLTNKPDNQDRLLALFDGLQSMVITGNVVGELPILSDDERLHSAAWDVGAGCFLVKNLAS